MDATYGPGHDAYRPIFPVPEDVNIDSYFFRIQGINCKL
jgi:hypothetical protein